MVTDGVVKYPTLVTWVRCLVCQRTYIDREEARLGECIKWVKPITENGVFVDATLSDGKTQLIRDLGGFLRAKEEVEWFQD